MTRRTSALAIAVAIAAIATVVLRWPSDGSGPARPGATSSAPAPPIQREPVPQASAQPGSLAAPTAQAPGSTLVASAPAKDSAVAPIAVQFVVPQASIQSGAAIDVLVSIDATRPLKTIAFDIAYDPALLRVRSLEEIDYSNDSARVRRGRFSVDPIRDGVVAVALSGEPLEGEAILGVVQFEAIRTGTGALDISQVRLTDRQGLRVPAAIATGRLPIAIN